MFRTLFLMFLIVPIIEIAFLIQVSEVIGGWTTIALVVVTAWFGARLVKQQGLQAVRDIQLKAANGQIPGEEIISGICILVSGVLLLTPGIFTDVLGFLLLTPPFRKQLIAQFKDKLVANMAKGSSFQFSSHTFYQQGGHGHHEESFSESSGDTDSHTSPKHPEVETDSQGHITIEGEYQKKD